MAVAASFAILSSAPFRFLPLLFRIAIAAHFRR